MYRCKRFQLTAQILSLLYVTLVGPTVEQLRLALSSLHTLYVNSNRFYFYLSFSSKACLGIPELKKLSKHFWDSLFLIVGPAAAWWHNRLLKIKQKVFLSDSVWRGRRLDQMDLPRKLKFPHQWWLWPHCN